MAPTPTSLASLESFQSGSPSTTRGSTVSPVQHGVMAPGMSASSIVSEIESHMVSPTTHSSSPVPMVPSKIVSPPGIVPIPVKSRTIKTDKPRPFLCPICTRGFVRQEHLRRHQRSHTNEKPYLCVFCGRCFARRDLVLRHQHKLHPSLINTKLEPPTVLEGRSNGGNSNGNSDYTSSPVSPSSTAAAVAAGFLSTGGTVPPGDKRIIKIDGNKRTILPTLSNPLAKTAAELKKEARLASKAATRRSKGRSKGVSHGNVKPARDKEDGKTAAAAALAGSVSPPGQLPGQTQTQVPTAPFMDMVAPKVRTPPGTMFLPKFTEGNYTPSPCSVAYAPTSIMSGGVNIPIREASASAPAGLPGNTAVNSVPEVSRDNFSNNARPSSAHAALPTHRRQRHASFSASSAYTYVENSNQPTVVEAADDLELREDIPHQVGFSTPQLTAKQVGERALECGIGYDPLDATPPFLSLDGNANTLGSLPTSFGMSTLGNGKGNIISTFNHPDGSYDPGFLHDFVTSSSVSARSLGSFEAASMNDHNLGHFGYGQPPVSKSFLNLSAMFTDPTNRTGSENTTNGTSNAGSVISARPNLAGMSANVNSPLVNLSQTPTPVTSGTQVSALNISNNSGSNFDVPGIPSTMLPSNQQTNSDSNPQMSAVETDDKLFANFISHSPLETDFKINYDLINDIGFAPLGPNSPEPETEDSGTHQQGILQSFNTAPSPTAQEGTLNSQNGINVLDYPGLNSIDATVPLDNVSNLFNSRQLDFFKEELDTNPSRANSRASSSASSRLSSPSGYNSNYIQRVVHSQPLVLYTESLRQAIIKDNQLTDDVFPKLDELNKYVNLYRSRFNKYLPFIHLYSIKVTMENYPLLLAITMIGSLYNFHSKHGMLLSNIAWFHIRKYLRSIEPKYEKTPLWLIQSIALLILISIFSNDMKIKKSLQPQLTTMIQLVRISRLNVPLELLIVPPIPKTKKRNLNDPEQIRKNFEYFILAQSRIRTCHVILLLTNFYSSLVGAEVCFHSLELQCGLPCYNEILYHVKDPQMWHYYLQKFDIVLDSNLSLVQLSNGNGTYQNYLLSLTNGNHQQVFGNGKVSQATLLSLLMSIHEKIFIDSHNTSGGSGGTSSKMIISSMMKNWETQYLRSGGVLVLDESNISVVRDSSTMKLIIPLYYYAKIRQTLNLTEVLNSVWSHDWVAMNQGLGNIYYGSFSKLQKATGYSLPILELWVELTSGTDILHNLNMVTTPISTVILVATSILITSEYLKCLEKTAFENLNDLGSNGGLSMADRVLWFNLFRICKKAEEYLLRNDRDDGTINSAQYQRLDRLQARQVTNPTTSNADVAHLVFISRLSLRCLHLTVRMLSISPVWSASLLFAQALQSRAIFNDMEARNVPEMHKNMYSQHQGH